MKKIILVDGNNLLFRSYYATAYSGVIMRNSKGFPTNGLYGFINMMNKIVAEENPAYILVAFDKGKTFRHDKYESYKDGRKETPDDLKLQFPKAKEVLEAMGIKYFEIDNYEADDIIGTVSTIVDQDDECSDWNATIISSDKDLLQLITNKVEVKLLKQKDYIRMDEQTFKETYKIDPIRMIDLKALMGDASDAIPGVKGIGEKTAISLLEKYESLDNLYDNIDLVTGKMKEKLIDDKENAYMSYDLAKIYTEVPLPFNLDELKYTGINNQQLLSMLEEFEFNSLIKRFKLNEESVSEDTIVKKEEFSLVIKEIKELDLNKPFSYYLEIRGTNYSKAELLGIGLYDGNSAYYIEKDQLNEYKHIFSSDIDKYTYDLKKNLVLLNKEDMTVLNTTIDAMIAGYLLDYTVKDDIAVFAQTMNYDIPLYEDIFGTEKRSKEVSKEELESLVCSKAKFIYETKEELTKRIKEEDLLELFKDIEMPLSIVLAEMEETGIKVNKEHLEEVSIELDRKSVV